MKASKASSSSLIKYLLINQLINKCLKSLINIFFLLEDVDFGVAVGRGEPGGGVRLLLALRLCGRLVEGVVRPGVVVALAVAGQVPMFWAQN